MHQLQGNKEYGSEKKGYLLKKSDGYVLEMHKWELLIYLGTAFYSFILWTSKARCPNTCATNIWDLLSENVYEISLINIIKKIKTKILCQIKKKKKKATVFINL